MRAEARSPRLYEAVLAGLHQVVQAQVVADPFDSKAMMGPLVNAKQRDRVRAYIELGKSEGARLAAGGAVHEGPGFFVNPTVFAGTNDMRIAQEEIFGPVATVISFESDEEIIRMSNDNRYAFAATLWTKDVQRVHTVVSALQAGAIGVNGWSPLAPQLPWGGTKESGIGSELGYEGILANTRVKTATVVL